MSGRFINPYPQFEDSTPNVYSGGKLFFYATGTSTPLSTYTTKALAVANDNPIILNSAGRPPGDIFLQDLEYKVVLKDSLDNVIWTADPVSHRDSALVAKTLTGSGSPNGSVAGTAGSASILPDFYWDYTNSILYVCTVTGSSSTAAWTALNASSSTAAVPPPQGRLTLTSSTPVLASDVVSATAVYYTPYAGNLIPIYNGSSLIPTEFSELTLTLTASHALNTIYDVFVFSNAGVLTVVTGPAWSVSTAGSGARGTGASTTQLTRIKGLWVNAVSMTGRNSSTTYSIGANLATYVGSIYMDATAGQITCHTAFGQSRKWGVWNAYNREEIVVQAGDATASWAYNSATVRASNGSSANALSVFCGLPEENVDARFSQTINTSYPSGGAGPLNCQVGIGLNSTTAFSGMVGRHGSFRDGTTNPVILGSTPCSSLLLTPRIGVNVLTALEASNATATNTFNGGDTNMQLVIRYRG